MKVTIKNNYLIFPVNNETKIESLEICSLNSILK